MKTQYTPGPWSRGSNFGGKCSLYLNNKSVVVAENVHSNLADKIVAALNSHDELLEALRLLKPYIDDMQKDNFNDSSAGIFEDQNLTSAVQKMYAAIAKATGEKESADV